MTASTTARSCPELANVNIAGLKEFDYFTFAKLGTAKLKFKPPVDYWLDYTKSGILTLHFTLPLEQPVATEAAEFDFSINDPSFFIAFELAKDDPVKLGANAPSGCLATVHDPAEENGSDTQQLNQAFSSALGTNGSSGANGNYGLGMSQTVVVHCAKS